MDDPDMEPEIQEDISLDEGGKMNWMLDKGLMLWKKALLTGILISSAPLVVPPLVVFSAIGLAFSVPSGLAVAGYACTEKIMSKLLPMPNPPSAASANVEEISRDDEEDKMVYGGEIGMRKEEVLIEDIKRGVGLRVEFVDEDKEERSEGNVLVELDNLGPECILNNEAVEPVILLGGHHLVEESGYEEDVEDNIPKKGEQPLGDIAMGVEESTDGKVRKLVIVFEKNDSKVEEIRDEHPVTEMQRVVVKVEKTDESVRGGGAPIQLTPMADITNENELAAEATQLLDRISDETKSMEEAKQLEKDISGGNQRERGVDNTVEADKLIKVGFEAVEGRSMMEEEQGHITCERTTLVIGGMDSGNSVAEFVPSDLRKENAISSIAGIREIADESGFEQNAAAEQYPYKVADVRSGFGGQNGRGFNPESKILSEKGNIVKSDEEQLEKVAESEEKIWERIMAMRAIVGYKAPASRTCAEELKALYVFTGVEPPSSSFKEPSDLMEVSSRLQFLMSIVGVE